MHLEERDINVFVRNFTKSFKNFCKKAPLLLSFVVVGDKVIIKNSNNELIKEFSLSFFEDPSFTIAEIKDFLLDNWYPVLFEVQKEEFTLSVEEISDLIKAGVSIDEALLRKKVKETIIRWRIEKINLGKNRLLIRNLETKELFLYKLTIPVTYFLTKINRIKNETLRWDLFFTKSFLVYKVSNSKNAELK